MQTRQKCCCHCPGSRGRGSTREDHDCCLPTYVRGNLRVSSLRKSHQEAGDAERSERLRGKPAVRRDERPSSCFERFAVARKFHAENLQHQPLPDRVDDAIFRNVRAGLNFGKKSGEAPENERWSSSAQATGRGARFSRRIKAGLEYGPSLGCKTPTTNMDLAICWEAPLDPSYEPTRAVHIDGTDGGPAPAIFTLVEHAIPQPERHRDPVKCLKNPLVTYEAKFSNLRNRCRCKDEEPSGGSVKDFNKSVKRNLELEAHEQSKNARNDKVSCSEKELCDNFESFNIEERDDVSSSRLAVLSQKIQPLHLRHCSSCECRGDRAARKPRPRLAHSAHVGTRNVRRNGLPTRVNVPRPRTPYAKRSFCIDTLTPPFSIVHGCRDADYPEHWRLTSVYQQSYRNPL